MIQEQDFGKDLYYQGGYDLVWEKGQVGAKYKDILHYKGSFNGTDKASMWLITFFDSFLIKAILIDKNLVKDMRRTKGGAKENPISNDDEE